MTKYTVRKLIPKKADKNLEGYSPLVKSLLHTRGIEDVENAEKFLNPKYEDLHDPFLLKDIDKAVERILSAIKTDEKIGIFSDYDADGIPGAVALHDFFKKVSFNNFINYIPLRNEEGFGLNDTAIENLRDQDVKLVITIDCGITDVAQVDLANKYGMDVIITDHHLPHEKLPKAFAIINPKQNGCEYPDKMLCGSGVIFKLIQALLKKGNEANVFELKDGQEKWFLDMVGLATLSDMVPLTNENRIISYYGMKVLQKSPRPGLQKLLSLLKINQNKLTEDDIGFMITPRINAASRMGVPLDAFKLLSTKDEVEAGVLAKHLDEKNSERKGVVGSMIREIKKKIQDRGEGVRNVLVFGNPEWKPSLLGLVANSFSDEHGRPSFFWGRNGETEIDGGLIKGSCRSGSNINIVKLMEKTKDSFVDYGGHHGAGGFSVLPEKIHTLEEDLNKAFDELEKTGELLDEEEVWVDKVLSLDEVSWNTWRDLEKFQPFGLDNPKPLFIFENVEIASSKLFGKEKNHLELSFKKSDGKEIKAIAFFENGEGFNGKAKAGEKVNLVAHIEKSDFRNFPELRLRIVDIF